MQQSGQVLPEDRRELELKFQALFEFVPSRSLLLHDIEQSLVNKLVGELSQDCCEIERRAEEKNEPYVEANHARAWECPPLIRSDYMQALALVQKAAEIRDQIEQAVELAESFGYEVGTLGFYGPSRAMGLVHKEANKIIAKMRQQ